MALRHHLHPHLAGVVYLVVAWSVADHMRTELVADTLKNAAATTRIEPLGSLRIGAQQAQDLAAGKPGELVVVEAGRGASSCIDILGRLDVVGHAASRG